MILAVLWWPFPTCQFILFPQIDEDDLVLSPVQEGGPLFFFPPPHENQPEKLYPPPPLEVVRSFSHLQGWM